jgi:hypothetical protein
MNAASQNVLDALSKAIEAGEAIYSLLGAEDRADPVIQHAFKMIQESKTALLAQQTDK